MQHSLTENNDSQVKKDSSSILYNKAKIFKDNAIEPNDLKWGQKLRDYKNSKKILNYDPKIFPKHITTKMIFDSQRQFNPITQKYYDEKKDQKITKKSKDNSISLISNGYDKQLEVESTYDIINLNNKLKYFNYDDSPKKSEAGYGKNDNQFDYEKNNVKPYNIISNLSLRKHNFLSPDLRPPNDDELIKSDEGLGYKKSYLLNKVNINEKNPRDFDIINNRYKLFNKEKISTEKQIQNLTAMKKMQNMKTYDIIRAKYINPTLEKELQKKEKMEKEKEKLKIKDKNYMVRNPLNNLIYDKVEQERLDDIEYDKKKRYLASGYIDDYYHSKSNNIETQKLISHQSYFNPFEYKILNKRGYDILTNKSQTVSEGNKYLTEIQESKLTTDWDKLKNNSDKDNNTFKSKNIFKVAYDTSDIDINYSNYLNLRKPTLNQRSNTIDNNYEKNSVRNIRKGNNLSKSIDDVFNDNRINPNINNRVYNKYENRIDYHMKYNNMDKGLFFGTPNSVLKKGKINY